MPDDNHDREFGRRLRALRKARGWTQADLAERSTLSADTHRRMEAGSFSPSLDTLRKAARGFGLSLNTLLAMADGDVPDEVQAIADFLRTRSPSERVLAHRILRALFENIDGLDG